MKELFKILKQSFFMEISQGYIHLIKNCFILEKKVFLNKMKNLNK